MRHLSPGKGLWQAIKADTLSLTAWQIGMYGWMAIATFLIFGHELRKTNPVFWFMMQIAMIAGFLTAYPVNVWLYDGVASKGRAADLTIVGAKTGAVSGTTIWERAPIFAGISGGLSRTGTPATGRAGALGRHGTPGSIPALCRLHRGTLCTMIRMRPHALLSCWVCCWLGSLCVAPAVLASELADLLPLTDRIVMLHFRDGQGAHHQRGQSRSEEKVITDPLDTAAASEPAAYLITSSDDARYAQPRPPVQVGRKSKGTDFAWFADKWENNRAVNTRPDHAKEHWLYLFLPEAMKSGCTYTLSTGNLTSNGGQWKLLFDERKARSEAVHVNLLGYVPAAPQKLGYVFHWMGDNGSLDLKPYENQQFHLIDASTGKPAFTGKLAFRRSATQQETAHKTDSPPVGNYVKADVYECDFSSFTQPGQYILTVEGIGCSFPFRMDADVYREAFRTMARGLYHNRSGIALEAPFTPFTRPAPHNPKLTPGFAGKLIYTTVRFTEWGSEGGNAKTLLASSKGSIDSCGWYQDAGDWDSYYSHLRVAQELLLAYEMAPTNFTDGELNIPESKNGVPDLLDEAAWLPRFCYRLRHELMQKGFGTGGIRLRIAGDAFGYDEKTRPGGKKVGQGSWEDVNRTWAASEEDPWSTYRYAGAAAHLAYCLNLAGVKVTFPTNGGRVLVAQLRLASNCSGLL